MGTCIICEGNALNVDMKKVEKLGDRFSKACERLKANPMEVATTIALFQEMLLDRHGILPMTSSVREIVISTAGIEQLIEED